MDPYLPPDAGECRRRAKRARDGQKAAWFVLGVLIGFGVVAPLWFAVLDACTPH
jgi:hypothetical protein